MKPWEREETRNKLKKLSPRKTVEMFFDLYNAGIEILRASLLDSSPELSKKEIKNKIIELTKSAGEV